MSLKIQRTEIFDRWLRALRDDEAIARINVRLNRLALGLAGDVKPVGEGVSELRVNYGPGYRVYFLQRGSRLILLLCGGDKQSQQRDIAMAKEIAATVKQDKSDD